MKTKKMAGSSSLKFLLLSFFITFFAFSLLVIQKENKQNFSGKAQTTDPKMTVIAKNLEVPWALDFLPDGNIIFTERAGKVKLLHKTTGQVTLIGNVPGIQQVSESGLLGIAVSPQFATNNYIFLYHSYNAGTGTQNKIIRYKLVNNQLTEQKTLIEGIPGNALHNGGRLKFGPDGFLYATTGDANNLSNPQNTNSLGGKILRMTQDGAPAPGNQFNNVVFTYGHRNPQGITWDGTTMYETEHGPSGAQSCCDEINRLVLGKNYGWADVKGPETKTGTETPLFHTGLDSANTLAPSGTAFYNGSIFFGGLRGQALLEAKVEGDKATIIKQHYKSQLGRIRDVVAGPDNKLYIATSNKDGRGTPAADDDKIIQLDFGLTNEPNPTHEPTVVPTFSCLGGCPTISEQAPTHGSEPTQGSEPTHEPMPTADQPQLTQAPTSAPTTNPGSQLPESQGLLQILIQLIITIILGLFGR